MFQQDLSFSAGDCEDGWKCEHRMDCPRFLEEQAKLEDLPSSSPERAELISRLKSLACNKEEKGVCCRSNFEIAGGTVVSRADQFPFIARIHIKVGFSSWSFCGGSLIRSNLLLTARRGVRYLKLNQYQMLDAQCTVRPT